MPPVPKKNRLSSVFSFLDNRKKEDIEIFETYMKFKEFNGDKSHPRTIKDMIKAIGNLLGLYNERLLLSISSSPNGYSVETVIDTTLTKCGKG